MYQYGHTFILHNKLVANYKLIYFKCFESNNKQVFWHKLFIFLKIVEQLLNNKRCKIKTNIPHERCERVTNSISKKLKKHYSRIEYLCKRPFVLKKKTVFFKNLLCHDNKFIKKKCKKKSQRQILNNIGLYWQSPMFSHDQLYIALS